MNTFIYNKPTQSVHNIPHPDGVYGLIEVGGGLSASLVPNVGWLGSLTHMQEGAQYFAHFAHPSGMSTGVTTSAYGNQGQENIQYLITQIPYMILNRWCEDSLRKVSRLIPGNIKLHMIGAKSFSAGDLSVEGVDLSTIGSDEIIGVTRFDGNIMSTKDPTKIAEKGTSYEARRILYHQRNKAEYGSGFLEECSESDPVYFVTPDEKLIVWPRPEEINAHALDGFAEISYLEFPNINVINESITNIPADAQHVVFLDVAIKCKEFQMARVFSPTGAVAVLNSNFQVAQLNTDLVDAIEKAQLFIDGLNEDITVKEYLSNEDVVLAETTLKASAAELQIASTQLAEQDKRASEYLQEYAQNISKFSQLIKNQSTDFNKKMQQRDILKDQYTESLYALRGELPSKKQLGESDKKLETIKQVVQR